MPWIIAAILAALILVGAGWALSQDIRDSTPDKIMRTVPDVEGLTRERAQRELASSGFEVEAQSRRSSAADAGRVLGQSPAAGERVQRGSLVTIELGEGPPTTRVPDVVGLTVPGAKTALGEADLAVGAQRKVPSASATEGVVVEQEYPPGTEVEAESHVNLGVSSGPGQVATPAASSTPSPASATATASAAGEDGGEDNSGPGSDNSGPGGGED